MTKIVTVCKFENKSNDKGIWFILTDEEGKVHHLFGNIIPDLASKKAIMQVGCTVELAKQKNEQSGYFDVIGVKASTVKEAVQHDQSAKYATQSSNSNDTDMRCVFIQLMEHRRANAPVPFRMYAAVMLWANKVVNTQYSQEEMDAWLLKEDSMFKIK